MSKERASGSCFHPNQTEASFCPTGAGGKDAPHGPARRDILSGPAFLPTCAVLAIPMLIAGLALGLSGTARAQSTPSSDEVISGQTDQVTSQILQDPYLQLRFIALSMESEDEQGTALNGLVAAKLVQDDVPGAEAELKLIEDPLWYARAAVAIADHRVETNDRDGALPYYAEAVRKLSGLQNSDPAIRVLDSLASKFAALGALDQAISAARAISDAQLRVEALRKAASAVQGDPSATARILAEAVADMAGLPPGNAGTAQTLIDLGLLQAGANAREDARKTLQSAREVIAAGPEDARSRDYARLGSALVSVGDRVQGMQVVREVPEGPDRAVAISGIAATIAAEGDLDSARPMFTLAGEMAQKVKADEDPDGRERAFSALIADLTRVGLLLDAFNTAGQLSERLRQSRALLGMGQVLLDQKKYDDALKLVDYIPYISMRAQIFATVAKARGEVGETLEASSLLARALEPTGFDNQPEFLPEALRRVLDAQLEFGAQQSDEAIFARAKELAETIPDPLLQVRALTRLATAEGERGFLDRAARTLASAYRVAYLNRNGTLFGEALADIAGAQLNIGDLVEAFDTAARIPNPTARQARETLADGRFRHPKWRALTAVAANAAADGKLPLGRRAANQIDYPPARAAAFAAMAVALADPTRIPSPQGELMGQ